MVKVITQESVTLQDRQSRSEHTVLLSEEAPVQPAGMREAHQRRSRIAQRLNVPKRTPASSLAAAVFLLSCDMRTSEVLAWSQSFRAR